LRPRRRVDEPRLDERVGDIDDHTARTRGGLVLKVAVVEMGV